MSSMCTKQWGGVIFAMSLACTLEGEDEYREYLAHADLGTSAEIDDLANLYEGDDAEEGHKDGTGKQPRGKYGDRKKGDGKKGGGKKKDDKKDDDKKDDDKKDDDKKHDDKKDDDKKDDGKKDDDKKDDDKEHDDKKHDDKKDECCTPSDEPSCENSEIEECVCSLDAFCCTVLWDWLCVLVAIDECGAQCEESPVPSEFER